MWKPTLIAITLALGVCGGAQAAGHYGNYPGVLAAGPGYTTVYLDENGNILGQNALGPVTPYIGQYGEAFRPDMLPDGAMSFGDIRVVPSHRRPYGPVGGY